MEKDNSRADRRIQKREKSALSARWNIWDPFIVRKWGSGLRLGNIARMMNVSIAGKIKKEGLYGIDKRRDEWFNVPL
ncbi:MAG: hypothetical protein PHT13_03215 [Methanosarcina sp.]|nr:hypothetical protein [Methanosarcina sp.]